MEEKTPDEFLRRQSHELRLAVPVIAPPERHLAVLHGHDPAVGDRHPMGVKTEIAQDVFRSGEGSLAVDHPFLAVEPVRSAGKDAARPAIAPGKDELAFTVRLLKQGQELAPELTGQYPDREEELLARSLPIPLRREPSARDQAVQVRMVHEVLAPGMQDRGQADLRPEKLWSRANSSRVSEAARKRRP